MLFLHGSTLRIKNKGLTEVCTEKERHFNLEGRFINTVIRKRTAMVMNPDVKSCENQKEEEPRSPPEC